MFSTLISWLFILALSLGFPCLTFWYFENKLKKPLKQWSIIRGFLIFLLINIGISLAAYFITLLVPRGDFGYGLAMAIWVFISIFAPLLFATFVQIIITAVFLWGKFGKHAGLNFLGTIFLVILLLYTVINFQNIRFILGF